MFLKKQHTTDDEHEPPQESLEVVALMPDMFYGGKNPVVYGRSVEKKTAESGAAPVKAPEVPQSVSSAGLITASAMGTAQSGLSPVPPRKIRRRVRAIFLVGGIFAVCGGVAGVWFIFFSTPEIDSESVPPPPSIHIPFPPENTLPPQTVATTTHNILSDTSIRSVSVPSFGIVSSPDADGDNLSDMEEELFGTDSGVWDTDMDGYYDGQEVWNLYNPKGLAHIRLIDSGIVREYRMRVVDAAFYYPASWSMGDVNSNEDTLLFTAQNGDYVAVEHFVKSKNEASLFSWIAAHAPQERVSELRVFTNRFGVTGYVRSDNQVWYAEDGESVFVFSYHAREGLGVYMQTFMMMVQSFRSQAALLVSLPDQVLLPQNTAPSSTTQNGHTSTTPSSSDEIDEENIPL
jgi:hypothetical protein